MSHHRWPRIWIFFCFAQSKLYVLWSHWWCPYWHDKWVFLKIVWLEKLPSMILNAPRQQEGSKIVPEIMEKAKEKGVVTGLVSSPPQPRWCNQLLFCTWNCWVPLWVIDGCPCLTHNHLAKYWSTTACLQQPSWIPRHKVPFSDLFKLCQWVETLANIANLAYLPA